MALMGCSLAILGLRKSNDLQRAALEAKAKTALKRSHCVSPIEVMSQSCHDPSTPQAGTQKTSAGKSRPAPVRMTGSEKAAAT